ncbi:hypothetical protein ACLOJK_030696 [Asimina triloba]
MSPACIVNVEQLEKVKSKARGRVEGKYVFFNYCAKAARWGYDEHEQRFVDLRCGVSERDTMTSKRDVVASKKDAVIASHAKY